jgi:hypothetical protein
LSLPVLPFCGRLGLLLFRSLAWGFSLLEKVSSGLSLEQTQNVLIRTFSPDWFIKPLGGFLLCLELILWTVLRILDCVGLISPFWVKFGFLSSQGQDSLKFALPFFATRFELFNLGKHGKI